MADDSAMCDALLPKNHDNLLELRIDGIIGEMLRITGIPMTDEINGENGMLLLQLREVILPPTDVARETVEQHDDTVMLRGKTLIVETNGLHISIVETGESMRNSQ